MENDTLVLEKSRKNQRISFQRKCMKPVYSEVHFPVEGYQFFNNYESICKSSFIHFQELEEKRETLFFRDGTRRIDYILAFTDTDDPKKVEKRELFEKNLSGEGLELEYEDKQVGNGRNSF